MLNSIISNDTNGKTDYRRHFIGGAKAISPVLLGVVPFSMISGISAINVGIPPLEAIFMSIYVFAGAAQLATVKLLGDQAPAVVVVMTGLIINLRFVMYSASIAPHFIHEPAYKKPLLAYLITDQAYAISITRFERGDNFTGKTCFYLGATTAMWATWQAGSLAGIIVGAGIPASWSLDFVIPLTFLAVMVPALKDRGAWTSAVTAGGIALLAQPLPYNLGLITAAVIGMVSGYLITGKKA